MSDTKNVGFQEFSGAVSKLFTPYISEEFTEADSKRVQRWLFEVEYLGLAEFGLSMLLRDLERLSAARVISPLTGTENVIDGSAVPGMLALARAVRTVESAPPDAGAAQAVGLRRIGALGVLGCAVRDLALTGRIALLMAHSAPVVAPWGSQHAAVGTNPVALGAPREDELPIVIDYATAQTLASIRQARAAGTDLPPPGGFTENGERTRDPLRTHVVAPEGRVASLTALMIEVLAGAMVGGREDVLARTGERGALLLAMDPRYFNPENHKNLTSVVLQQWREAGGHVPARFDQLPVSVEHLRTAVSNDVWKRVEEWPLEDGK